MTGHLAPPLITFAEAEQIGAELHDRWDVLAGEVPLSRDDMAWGDIVQFVVRRARDLVGERISADEIRQGLHVDG